MDLHCENHLGEIEVRGIDTSRPHAVTVSLDRGSGSTGLAVTQDGTPAARSRSSVPGVPDLAAGEPLRVQLRAAPGTTFRVDGLEVDEVN